MLFKKALGAKLEKNKHDGTNQTNFWRNLTPHLTIYKKIDNYVVYEVTGKRPAFVKIDTVRATSSEAARRKAIIGTNKKYVDTVAAAYNPIK